MSKPYGIINDNNYLQKDHITPFFANATATGFAYVNVITPNSLVTSKATASASSTKSYQDAYLQAYDIAQINANTIAQNDANLINQSVLLSIQNITSGTTGPTGYQGDVGTQGYQGAQGFDGSIGAQGFQGATGSGSQGTQGAQGSDGSIGAQGFQGATGSGSQGTQGAQGAQGAAGSGSQGAQGAAGTAGAQGAQGAAGTAGAQGAAGTAGAQGAAGTAGAQGAAGSAGSQGAQGAAGTAGAQGAQGSAGSAGAQGFQGAAGSGSQGAQGAAGSAGSQGAQGAAGSGSQGAQGAQGSAGSAGIQGAQGATGSGSQGIQGAQGSQGPVGSGGNGNNSSLILSEFGISFNTMSNAGWNLITSLPSPKVYSSIALSGSGQYQTIVRNGDYGLNSYLYGSSDFGVTWNERYFFNTIDTGTGKVCISSSGQYQIFTGQRVYTSNDYGITWTFVSSLPSTGFTIGCTSTSGQYQVVTGYEKYVYLSNDYGVSWNASSKYGIFGYIAMSGSGQYLLLTDSGFTYFYKSNNYGVTWSTVTELNINSWRAPAISENGQIQVIAAFGGQLYISRDYGITWSILVNSPSMQWGYLTMSSTGQYMTATGGGLWNSSDFGNSWFNLFGGQWLSVSISSSGRYQGAIAFVNYSTVGCPVYRCVSNLLINNDFYLTGATGQTGGAGNINNSKNNVYCNNVYALSAVYANNVALSSDYRIKENIQNLDDHFKVDYLKPVRYINKQTNKTDIGLIAHELQEIFPELVSGEKDGEEIQRVNYIGLIPILIHEIKELKNKVIDLDSEIKILKNK